jgi:hypothetical protein
VKLNEFIIFRLQSAGTWSLVVWQTSNNTSEKLVTSVFKVEEYIASYTVSHARKRKYEYSLV